MLAIFFFFGSLVVYLSVLTVLGGLQLIRGLNKVERVSWEPWDYVTELEAKHHQPALHIYSSRQEKRNDFAEGQR